MELKEISQFLVSPKFLEIAECHETLKVPVQSGVLQVGIKDPAEFTNLTITKDSKSDIYIARQDTQPIQIEVHPLTDLDGEERRTVFNAPFAGKLSLTHYETPTAHNLWDVEAGQALIQDRYAFLRFTKEIGSSILIRQIDRARAQSVSRVDENALARSS